ncbi:MAG: aldolase/citrate lyase family protein [Anaerolineae bacterium]
MRENRIRSVWQTGGTAINGWLHIPSSYAAELMAHQGWDSLTVDLQHGLVDYYTAVPMLQAISTTNVTPLVRVPWNDPGIIMKMLDAGAFGVIGPMINTRQDAASFVGACRYPPQGYRSYGPTRAALYAGSDYGSRANETILTIAMIETAEALDNLDDILSVPGLDAIYIGPNDLSQSLGETARLDRMDDGWLERLEHIVAAATQHGVVAGIHTNSSDYALLMIEKGFRFTTVMTDSRLLSWAAGEAVKAMRAGQSRAGAAAVY